HSALFHCWPGLNLGFKASLSTPPLPLGVGAGWLSLLGDVFTTTSGLSFCSFGTANATANARPSPMGGFGDSPCRWVGASPCLWVGDDSSGDSNLVDAPLTLRLYSSSTIRLENQHGPPSDLTSTTGSPLFRPWTGTKICRISALSSPPFNT